MTYATRTRRWANRPQTEEIDFEIGTGEPTSMLTIAGMLSDVVLLDIHRLDDVASTRQWIWTPPEDVTASNVSGAKVRRLAQGVG